MGGLIYLKGFGEDLIEILWYRIAFLLVVLITFFSFLVEATLSKK